MPIWPWLKFFNKNEADGLSVNNAPLQERREAIAAKMKLFNSINGIEGRTILLVQSNNGGSIAMTDELLYSSDVRKLNSAEITGIYHYLNNAVNDMPPEQFLAQPEEVIRMMSRMAAIRHALPKLPNADTILVQPEPEAAPEPKTATSRSGGGKATVQPQAQQPSRGQQKPATTIVKPTEKRNRKGVYSVVRPFSSLRIYIFSLSPFSHLSTADVSDRLMMDFLPFLKIILKLLLWCRFRKHGVYFHRLLEIFEPLQD